MTARHGSSGGNSSQGRSTRSTRFFCGLVLLAVLSTEVMSQASTSPLKPTAARAITPVSVEVHVQGLTPTPDPLHVYEKIAAYVFPVVYFNASEAYEFPEDVFNNTLSDTVHVDLELSEDNLNITVLDTAPGDLEPPKLYLHRVYYAKTLAVGVVVPAKLELPQDNVTAILDTEPADLEPLPNWVPVGQKKWFDSTNATAVVYGVGAPLELEPPVELEPPAHYDNDMFERYRIHIDPFPVELERYRIHYDPVMLDLHQENFTIAVLDTVPEEPQPSALIFKTPVPEVNLTTAVLDTAPEELERLTYNDTEYVVYEYFTTMFLTDDPTVLYLGSRGEDPLVLTSVDDMTSEVVPIGAPAAAKAAPVLAPKKKHRNRKRNKAQPTVPVLVQKKKRKKKTNQRPQNIVPISVKIPAPPVNVMISAPVPAPVMILESVNIVTAKVPVPSAPVVKKKNKRHRRRPKNQDSDDEVEVI